MPEKIKQIYDAMFRGTTSAREFLQNKIGEFYDDYSKSYLYLAEI